MLSNMFIDSLAQVFEPATRKKRAAAQIIKSSGGVTV